MSETSVVTLLFVDLVGSTELLTALGDDVADDVRRRFLSALAKAAGDHGGTVVKSAGDGLMVTEDRRGAADQVRKNS